MLKSRLGSPSNMVQSYVFLSYLTNFWLIFLMVYAHVCISELSVVSYYSFKRLSRRASPLVLHMYCRQTAIVPCPTPPTVCPSAAVVYLLVSSMAILSFLYRYYFYFIV